MNKMHMVQSWLEAQITPITSRNKIQHSLINVSLCRSLRHYVTPTMSAYTSKTLWTRKITSASPSTKRVFNLDVVPHSGPPIAFLPNRSFQ